MFCIVNNNRFLEIACIPHNELCFSFLEYGSDAIETATYQATVTGFVKHLNISEEEAHVLIRKGAELACQSRDQFWQDHPELHHGQCHVGDIGENEGQIFALYAYGCY